MHPTPQMNQITSMKSKVGFKRKGINIPALAGTKTEHLSACWWRTEKRCFFISATIRFCDRIKQIIIRHEREKIGFMADYNQRIKAILKQSSSFDN